VVPKSTATPDVAGYPGDAPQMAHDQYAVAVGPKEWDELITRLDSVQHPSSMEQPPHVPIDPDSRTYVAVPLKQTNIPFKYDSSWELSEDDQRLWYRARQMADEFIAQKTPLGPFTGVVSHQSAARRGLLLRHLGDQLRSNIGVEAVISILLVKSA